MTRGRARHRGESLESALVVRSRILSAFEAAEMETDPARERVAHVRRRRRRPDRRRDGRTDRRARARHPAPRLPQRRPARRRGSSSSRRPTASSPSFPPCSPRRRSARSTELGVTVLTGRSVVGIDATGSPSTDSASTPERIPTPHRDLGRGSDCIGPRDEARPSSSAPSATVPVASRSQPDITLPGPPRGLRDRRHGPGARRDGEPSSCPGSRRSRCSRAATSRRSCAPRLEGRDDGPVPLPRQGQPCDDRPRQRSPTSMASSSAASSRGSRGSSCTSTT